jgi:hypothetical protein
MNRQVLSAIVIGMMMSCLSGCIGGGDDEDEDAEEDFGPPDASGAGIWFGTQRIDGETNAYPMLGIVTEEGDYAFYATNIESPLLSRLFFGTGSTNGNNFSANAVTYLSTGRSLPAAMQGTIIDGVSISGSYSLTDLSATFELAFQPTFLQPASFAVLQGVYSASATDGIASIAVTIEANGAITAQYSGGCMFSGNVRIPHSNRNYYRANVTFSNCGAMDGAASLLMFLNDALSGPNNQLFIFEQHQNQTRAGLLVVRR